MGQAKKRGTFEERSQQAIARHKEQARKRIEEQERNSGELQAAWDALTEQEQHLAKVRAARNHRGERHLTTTLMAMRMLAEATSIPFVYKR
jgi:hypothetical protein